MNIHQLPPTTAASRKQITDRLKTIDLEGLAKDSALTAIIVLLLCVPIIGFKLEKNQFNILELASHWGWVVTFVIATFLFRFVRLASATYRNRTKESSPTSAKPQIEEESSLSAKLLPLTGYILVGIAFTFPIIAAVATGGLAASRSWLDLAILALTYVMLGWGLNIVVGLAGLLDLGYVAFYAVGAYTYALLATNFGVSFWICLPLAGILAAFWGIILGFPILRLRGDYLAIVTLAFGEITRLVLLNWESFSNGANGISSIPKVTFFGIPFTSADNGFAATFGLPYDAMHRWIFLYYLILALALLTNFITIRMRRLPIGRAWEALREDETACRSLGINTRNTKLTAFAIGAMFGGIAGAFFSARQGFVSPESFNFMESAIILAIVVLGGMGSQVGVAIAAVVLTVAPELLRNMTFLKNFFGDSFDPSEYRLLLFGLAMVAMMVWRPRGLISVRNPTVSINKTKAIGANLVKEGHG
ncbi:high-affinity branched-chain amino acid ABC transporter permease LivM [Microvirga sp. W0021]|uniref:High-affinity branched-chain amino acid ABC transporter permease LivM n=1 Tax=Hohaiivirga grylli TaxID=3133970 RepID=A0ABV0BMC9_9HYPH